MARYPGAEWLPFSGPSGSFTGGPFKIVHHTTEGSSAAGAFSAYRANRSDPHFTVDDGKIYQHIDTGVAARALRNRPGGVQTNRDSAIQIEVVGFAHRPKSRATLRNVARLCRWIEATHGVPKVWPNGRPRPARDGVDPGGHNRDAHVWDTKGGHYGHSNVPENTHWDPAYSDDEVEFLMRYSGEEGPAFWDEFSSIPETDPGLASDYSRMPDHGHVEKHPFEEHSAQARVASGAAAREEARMRLENLLGGFGAGVLPAVEAAVASGRIDPVRFGIDPAAILPVLDRIRPAGFESRASRGGGLERLGNIAGLEAIVRRVGRPPLLIRNDRVQFEPVALLPQLTQANTQRVDRFVPSVGRVEFVNHAFRWGGTGFVVDEAPGGRRKVVTNRHVARLVARRGRGGEGIFLRSPIGARYGARLDMREEVESLPGDAFTLPVTAVAYIADDTEADVALLEIETRDGLAPDPIPLAPRRGREGELVATIGYPAFDDRNDLAQMHRYFNDLYDVKRFSPGLIITDGEGTVLSHDCTTLGGSSGSCLISLEQEGVVGLHFAGEFGVQNAAVSAATLKDLLSGALTAVAGPPPEEGERADGAHEPSELAERGGYDPLFLGEGLAVPWPEFGDDIAADLARPSDADDERPHELRYTHFGVLFSTGRRTPRVTAVNIDGSSLRHIKRGDDRWFFDLRIDRAVQLGQGAYRDRQIDRGHLVRRQDPNWGDDALQANDDTFHYTNAALQHSTLNQGNALWLGLENYILDSARTEGFRASVFTGPVFRDDDPELAPSNAQVPQEFWKIVVMPRPEGGLHATGYLLSQGDLIRELLERRSRAEAVEGFVLGAYRTFQIAIRHIEEITGLSFPVLRDADPLARTFTGEETIDGGRVVYLPVESIEDIRLDAPAPQAGGLAQAAGEEGEALAELETRIESLGPAAIPHRLVALQESIGDDDAALSDAVARLFQAYHGEVVSAADREEAPAPAFADLKRGYETLYASARIRPEWRNAVAWHVGKLKDFRPRYEAVGGKLGIPWWFVGITHALEGSFSFRGHLHNGDPLGARTVQVPKNRPAVWNPPNDWESSAIDALTLKGYDRERDWSVPRALYRFEAYNGWGYRPRGVNSPYLWSFSDHYTKGKYVRDGRYDPDAVSRQCGAAVLLKALDV